MMVVTIWILRLCGVASFLTQIEGYVCDHTETIIVPEETVARFEANFTGDVFNKPYGFQKVSDSHMYIFSISNDDDNKSFVQEHDHTWGDKVIISSQLYSDNSIGIRFDLNSVSLEDNGTYLLYSFEKICYNLYIMTIKTQPIDFQEENEPLNVYLQPHVSLVSRLLNNTIMVLLIHGVPANQVINCIKLEDRFWLSRITKDLNGKNITYRVILDDDKVIEINKTLIVRYGPSFPITLKPRKAHFNLASGDLMPDITCSSECYPPCNISWGEHGKGRILRLGKVSSTSTGEYTCTVARSGGRTINQTISIIVSDNSFLTIAIICLSAIQGITITTVGLCAYSFFNRKCVARSKSDETRQKISETPNLFRQGQETKSNEYLKRERRYIKKSFNEEIDFTGDGTRPVSVIYKNTVI